jgi:rfaE bifunctional protein kinase chain/domain/rfaE bifunctional protein nucleotidyltransferase chain/domain
VSGPEHVSPELAHAIRQQAPVVTVLGDFLLDGWWRGSSERMAREAPAPIVDVESRSYAPGGAANTAMNLAALGANVRAVGLIGDDDAGRTLRGLLAAAGVDLDGLLTSAAITTTTKTRILGAGQVLVRVDDTYAGDYPPDAVRQLTEAALAASAGADAEVICDYGSRALNSTVVRALAARARKPRLSVIDAHDPSRWSSLKPDLATPNAHEAARLIAADLPPGGNRPAWFTEHADELFRATGSEAVIVTLDRDGTVLLTRDRPAYRTWAVPVTEKQASGAGDTFVAALTAARSTGLPLTTSVDFAQAAADVVVRRFGTSVCSTDDLTHHLGHSAEVLDERELADRLAVERANGRRIVLTNGCFDVLHPGHTASLNQARALGDVLVVAVNGDESTRRLKGEGRPVNRAEDRAGLLSALASVDYVTIFETDTPIPLIERIRPDVYAKGGDYTPQMLEESDVVTGYGGEVRILDYVPAQSTTAVVERILGAGNSGRPEAVVDA